MGKTGYRILAQIVDYSGSLTGYMVYHVPSKVKKLANKDNTIQFVKEKGCDNAEVVSGVLKGTESSLDRLPKFDMAGNLLNEGRLVVLGVFYKDNKEQSIQLLDGNGMVKVFSWVEGLALLNKVGAVNAKLVGSGSKVYLSAIIGSLTKLGEESVKEKGNVADYFNIEGEVLKKFYPQGRNKDKRRVVSVVIPEGVREIEGEAFDNVGIKSVELPESLESIGLLAFGANELTFLRIPESVRFIAPLAFVGNSKLRLVVDERNEFYKAVGESLYSISSEDLVSGNYRGDIAEGTITIYPGAFDSKGLEDIKIPGSVAYIEDEAFASNNIKSVIIPNGTIRVGINAFMSNKLESIIIPGSVKDIGEGAFLKNDVKRVILPDSLDAEMLDEAFDNNVEYEGKGEYILKGNVFKKVK